MRASLTTPGLYRWKPPTKIFRNLPQHYNICLLIIFFKILSSRNHTAPFKFFPHQLFTFLYKWLERVNPPIYFVPFLWSIQAVYHDIYSINATCVLNYITSQYFTNKNSCSSQNSIIYFLLNSHYHPTTEHIIMHCNCIFPTAIKIH